MGKVISLRVSNLPAKARKVVKQIETPRLSDPIMRRPRADREEKRVTHGNETSKESYDCQRVTIATGRLDANDPNQRGLSEDSDRFSSDASCHPLLHPIALANNAHTLDEKSSLHLLF